MASLSAVLSEIAKVRTVALFRDRPPEHTPSGNVAILTIKDLTASWPVDFDKLPKTYVEADYLPQAIQSGDILMPARGDYYPARHIPGSTGITLFPAGQIHVISPLHNTCSGFLAWYLNLTEVQATIQSLLTGTSIHALNKSRLLTLPLSIPDIEIQEEISKLHEMQTRWAALAHEQIRLKNQEVEFGCLKLLKRGI